MTKMGEHLPAVRLSSVWLPVFYQTGEKRKTELRELKLKDDEKTAAEAMEIIRNAFAAPPWNDAWEEDGLLRQYLTDIAGNVNSLSLGLYEEEQLVGLALGWLKHWFDGVEFCVDDLCVRPDRQGRGVGSALLRAMKEYTWVRGYKEISLRTDRTATAYRFYCDNGFKEERNRVYFSLNLNQDPPGG